MSTQPATEETASLETASPAGDPVAATNERWEAFLRCWHTDLFGSAWVSPHELWRSTHPEDGAPELWLGTFPTDSSGHPLSGKALTGLLDQRVDQWHGDLVLRTCVSDYGRRYFWVQWGQR